MEVREERPCEREAIRYVNEQAFGSPAEANLIEALRDREAFALSMVALTGETIVAHILFTKVRINSGQSQFLALGLGPMAVLPSHQRKGIGSQLLKVAIDKCRELGHEIIFVVGHPGFYSKFSFVPATKYGIKCEFDVPDEAFMVLELRRNALTGRSGVVLYDKEFKNSMKTNQ